MTTPTPAVTLIDEQVLLYIRDMTGLPEDRVYKGQEISEDEDRPIPKFLFANVLGSPHLPQCFAQTEYVYEDDIWLERAEVNFQAAYSIEWSGPGAFVMAHEFEGRLLTPYGHQLAGQRNFTIQDSGQVQETSATVAEDWDQRAGVDMLISYWMQFDNPVGVVEGVSVNPYLQDTVAPLITIQGSATVPTPTAAGNIITAEET